MIIRVGERAYELKTTLGTTRKIEEHYNGSLSDVMQSVDEMTVDQLSVLLSIAAGQGTGDMELRDAILDNWDYSDLLMAAQGLIARLMYSGTPEQVEAKLDKQGMDEQAKNEMKRLLEMTE